MPTETPVEYTVYLIGDAGKPSLEKQGPVLKLLQLEFEKSDSNSAVVFLGDNIYPYGLPPEDDDPVERVQAEKRLAAQLNILENFKGRPFVIPGNHDWNMGLPGGLKNVKEQGKYIKKKLDSKQVFLPRHGCPGPVEVQLSKNLLLIIIDSQWWLHNDKKEPGFSKGCDIKAKEDFLLALKDLASRHRNKDILLASHHPLFSNGPHGGYFSWKDHLFPLTQASHNLFIPLPVIGTILPAFRKIFGHVQDLAHPDYKALKEGLLGATEPAERLVFAAGHEHSLQFHQRDERHFVVSGSGSKTSYSRKGHKADFTYSKKGFSKMIYYQNGEVWTEFWKPIEEGSTGQLVFRKKLEDARKTLPEIVEEKTFDKKIESELIKTKAAGIYNVKKFKSSLLGAHYRDVWNAEIEMPVINLEKEHGGLTPIKRGGGMQTKSLRLEDPKGRQYVLRSIQKDVTPVVPKFLKKTFAHGIIQDQISASHPYAAMVVPALADAAGVYHTNPKAVYLPAQKALGSYNEQFAGQVYLYEERPKGSRKDVKSFGRSKNIVSTSEMLEAVHENQNHIVDQKAVLRARLFDIWLNDWDRHDDQWRWATKKKDGKTIYKPIPRDRDQAFFKFDGFIPWLATRKWILRNSKFQSFEEDIYNLRGITFNARYFDRSFLTEPELKDWIKTATKLQEELTDSIIESAIKQWPDEVFEKDGEDVIRKLKARRDRLFEFAAEFYGMLAKVVDVVGTDEAEHFEIERKYGGLTKVIVHRLSDKGKKKKKYYERTFKKYETKEIRLYGLKGDDEFVVKGESRKAIKVRIIGGGGEDKVKDKSVIRGALKRTLVYDKKYGAEIKPSREIKDKTSNRVGINDYNRLAFKFNVVSPVLFFGYNVDDGIFAGAGFKSVKHGFRKELYKSSQTLAGNIAVATQAFNFKYHADYTDAIGRWNIEVLADLKAPNFQNNYFGFGNETELSVGKEDDNDFNRLRLFQFAAEPLLKRSLALVKFVFTENMPPSETSRNGCRQSPVDGKIKPELTFQFCEIRFRGFQVHHPVSGVKPMETARG